MSETRTKKSCETWTKCETAVKREIWKRGKWMKSETRTKSLTDMGGGESERRGERRFRVYGLEYRV